MIAAAENLPGVSASAQRPAHRFDATIRLAEGVSRGEVVFFVGSGFSIDSEGNSASRLVGRLLAGILAMDTVLAEEVARDPIEADPGSADATRRRRDECATLDGLRQVFGLEGAEKKANAPREPARCMTESNLKLLAREYYNFNEWAVSTLTVLSSQLISLAEARREEATQRIERLGTYLLELVGDSVPLEAIDWRALNAFDTHAARGKALFLDVMGFANPVTMAGNPYAPSVEAVTHSYAGRLRPRHHALARLAREGVATAVVTTNYDLLIEGAYRLAGLLPRDVQPEVDDIALAVAPRFSRIAGADQFFASGEGQRQALLLKIHGSVDTYREAREHRRNALDDPGPDMWSRYLPAIVFTYREIQTWRADAWSRDLIRTMLRTNTLALCGYSGADPIMHATFREVYEERAAALGPTHAKGDRPPAKTPVFFFGLASRREFHSLEILRAASAAVGNKTGELLEHPNLIEFERSEFPTIDDHFRLIVHEVVRDLQSQALRARLRRLAPQLLGNPCPDAEYNLLLARFKELRAAEDKAVAAAGKWSDAAPADRQRKFDRVVDWTWHFVPGLLGELALAEFVESRRGPRRVLRTHRLFPAYQAASERPEWSAWAVIVELALRAMVVAVQKLPAHAVFENESISVEESPHAAISFAPANGRRLPQALYIRLAGFDRPGRAPEVTGAFYRVAYWQFGERDVPWPLRRTGLCPRPGVLWDWALGREVDGKKAARYLGITNR